MLCFYLAIPIRTISKNLPLTEGFFVLRSYRTEYIGPLGDGPRFGT